LHYERHHSGVPTVDPAEHKLLIHGMVDRPLIFTMDDLRRLPSVSRICFIECAGNSHLGYGTRDAPTVQLSHGLASCSEWTGVRLSLLLSEAGVQPGAKWILAEGADACKMQRSIPLEKAMDDIIVAYAQNGEALRPEQGYPVRLVIPGWEGNTNVKWLRRIKAVDQPYMTRDETSKYTDPLPDGTARQFTFTMEAKSVVTFPSGGQKLPGAGFYEITGLAWSGRGRIERVEISTDGGVSWQNAELSEPRLPIAFTRFRLPWRWDGREATVQSRATDETGYVQPSHEALAAVRGAHYEYHNNAIRPWKVLADGSVSDVVA
jgi:sulfane dehydrogenase subunit SoxC